MYKKSLLQPSLSVRLANVPSGTKLLLVAKTQELASSQITIALQTEDYSRLISKFSIETSLWDILRYFEVENNINLTRKTVNAKDTIFQTNEVYVLPVCVFMNREFQTIRELKGITLKSLGLIQGNAVIRLLGKVTDKPIEMFLPDIETNNSIALQKNVSVPSAVSISTMPSEMLSDSFEPSTLPISQRSEISSATVPLEPSTLPISQSSEMNGATIFPGSNQDTMSTLNFNVDIYKPAPKGITEKSKLNLYRSQASRFIFSIFIN
jgi:hypothetical protein